MKKIFLVSGFLVSILISCSKTDNNNPGTTPPPPPTAGNCNGVDAKFVAVVDPIIQSRCAASSSCHANGSNNGPGALTTFNQIKNAAASLKSAVQSGRMPKGSSLTAAQIKSIACWVDAGAPNN